MDTAGIITLYYKEQIQSIDTSEKIKGSNVLNDKVRWIKDFVCNVRPESAEELPVVIVADYLTSWIIDALKLGKKHLDTSQSLPHQLWLYVAKQNPLDQEAMKRVADTVGLSAGQQMIPLAIRKSSNTNTNEKVPLRCLIGCVTVIGEDGEMYQFPGCRPSDQEIFGYVYLKPFSSDTKVLHSITHERNLKSAQSVASATILSKFEDLTEVTKAYANENPEHINNVLVTQDTASQVAQALHQTQDLSAKLKEVKETIEVNIDVLREDIEEKKVFYQTSIDAAHEQIKQESILNRETMQKENHAHFQRISNQLTDQLNEIEKYLNEQMKKYLSEIQQEMREKTKEIVIIAETAKLQSIQAIEQANQAHQNSQKAVQEANQTARSAQSLVESTEERRREFQLTASNCVTEVTQTVASLRQIFEKNTVDMCTKVENDVTRAKKEVHEASNDAKEAAANARDVHKSTREQLELQKKETDKTLAAIKDTRQQCDRAAAAARQAENHAEQAANTAATAMKKVDAAVERVDKLIRKV